MNDQNKTTQIAGGVFLGGLGLLLTWFILLPLFAILLWIAVVVLATMPEWIWTALKVGFSLTVLLYIACVVIDSFTKKKVATTVDTEFETDQKNWSKERQNYIASWNK